MESPQHDTDGPGERGVLQHLGGRWVWISVALLAVIALSVRWLVQPERSTTDRARVATTVTSTSPMPTSTTAPPTTASPAPVADAPEISGLWTMPDVVGRNLADAKGEIVDLTDGRVDDAVAVTDASGDGRRQIIHENWTVCSQEPAPGAAFTPESGVALSVVKNNESCPNESAATTGASTDRPVD